MERIIIEIKNFDDKTTYHLNNNISSTNISRSLQISNLYLQFFSRKKYEIIAQFEIGY